MSRSLSVALEHGSAEHGSQKAPAYGYARKKGQKGGRTLFESRHSRSRGLGKKKKIQNHLCPLALPLPLPLSNPFLPLLCARMEF